MKTQRQKLIIILLVILLIAVGVFVYQNRRQYTIPEGTPPIAEPVPQIDYTQPKISNPDPQNNCLALDCGPDN